MKDSLFPRKAIESHIAILGKTGSGKTFCAKGIVEELLRDRQRVCIIDPTGAWFGLRSDASGKKAGFPVVVFGGDHADVPLTAESGEELAEIIATSDVSAVLDTSNMRVGEQTRFFADFADALRRTNRAPLHLVIDEAHNFIPQGKVADPQSAKMLHAANKMLSEGRSRGLRVMLLSQRPQKVHKDSLTQVETLVAMRLIAPQDRRAVEDWIGACADPDQGDGVLASLPTLPTGEGWIWAPEIGLLKRAKFPRITTYDSSAAPDGKAGEIVLAKIDLPSIHARLESVAKTAEQNDPKRLKARIAELEKAKGKPDAAVLQEARQAGFAEGLTQGRAETDSAVREALARAGDRLRVLAEDLGSAYIRAPKAAPRAAESLKLRPEGVKSGVESPKLQPPRPPTDGITNPQQRILDAIATLMVLGVENITKEQAALVAGVKPTSGSFGNNVGRLRTIGLMEPSSGDGLVGLTDAGRNAANFPDRPPSVASLQQVFLSLLTNPQAAILKAAIAVWPEATSKDDLAAAVGVQATSGSFGNNLGRLRTLSMIDYPTRGQVRAEDILFPQL